MKIETPENFDDGVTQVAPKIKTLKEKREEVEKMINKISKLIEDKKLRERMSKNENKNNKKKEILKKIVVARIKQIPDNLRLEIGRASCRERV